MMQFTVGLVHLLTLVPIIDSFHVGITTKKRSCQSYSIQSSSFPLHAKPPPTSLFDLEAIETFEKSLLTPASSRGDYGGDDEFDELEDSEDGCASIYHTIPKELKNKRIDAAIAALEPKLSRSTCGNLVADGFVFLVTEQNGETNKLIPITKKSEKVQEGQTLKIIHEQQELPSEIIPENIPLNIIFEDEHMIVLNKAAGMVVHPAAGNWDGTLVNALAYYLANESPYGSGEFVNNDNDEEKQAKDETDGEIVYFRPGIVHRLDKGTTGIITVAKTKAALAKLSEAFAERRVKKTYVAITVGNPGKQVKIDKPIGRHPVHRQRMRVVPDPGTKNSRGHSRLTNMNGLPSPSIAGRRALSYVDTKAFDGRLSVVEVKIETGRTHQIRVHLKDRRTPIYGDDIYGLSDWNKLLNKKHKIARPLLHAHRLEMDHPFTGEKMVFNAPMADDMSMIAKNVWPQGMDERPELFSS